MKVRRSAATVALLALVFAGLAVAATRQTTVKATEIEWQIKLSKASVPAGSVMFDVRNAGKLAHQFIVLRTNRAPAKLPTKGTKVDAKAAGTLIGQLKSIAPGKSAHLKVTLKAGRYVLFCNMPAHYKQGQYVGFRVK